jgi:hypothetical protein
MTRLELIKKSRDHGKCASWALLIALLIFLVWMGFVLWLNHALNQLESIGRGDLRIITSISLLGCIFMSLIIAGLLTKRYRRKQGLNCPNCKIDLIGSMLQIAVASGRYGRCGKIILEDWNK